MDSSVDDVVRDGVAGNATRRILSLSRRHFSLGRMLSLSILLMSFILSIMREQQDWNGGFINFATAEIDLQPGEVALQWKFKLISSIPIRNLSGVTEAPTLSSENDESDETDRTGEETVIEADYVATVVKTLSTASLRFASSVLGWSEVIFVPAPCYVPLCGDDFDNISWVPTDTSSIGLRPYVFRADGEIEDTGRTRVASRALSTKVRFLQSDDQTNFETEEQILFQVCCAVADTQPLGGDDECTVNPLQSCREQNINTPCSSVVALGDQDDESDEQSECVEGLAVMQMLFQFEKEVAPETCCLTCTCYGDPRCISFSDETDLWVLCDARGPVKANVTDSTCVIKESVCQQQLDHDGKQCQWKNLTTSEEATWTVLTNGSRCVPNAASAESWITMYSFDLFAFEIRQEERGIIDKVNVALDSLELSMTADDCFTGDFNHSWKDNNDEFVVPPDYFVQIIQTPTASFIEYLWAISDPVTLMHMRIRCLVQRDDKGNQSPPRIHVDALVEPEINIEDARSEPSGFCFTGDLGKTGSTQNTETILDGDGCTENGKLNNDETLAIARAFCGQALLYSSIPNCIISFCEANYFPNFDDYAACVTIIGDGSDGYDFREAFCTAMTFTDADKTDCLALWDNKDGLSGPLFAVDKYYNTQVESGVSAACAHSVDELPTSLGECEAGVEIQYLDDSFTWVTVFAIPENFPPCSLLQFNIRDHRVLFVNPFRVKQCTVSAECMTADNYICKTEKGFAAQFLLLPFYTDDSEVTDLPTSSPTKSPTHFPTEFPTFFPTLRPTTSPVPSDMLTDSPSESPTMLPTRIPTESPTHRATRFPTESPTRRQTQSPGGPSPFPTKSPTRYSGWGISTAEPTFAPTISPASSNIEPPSKGPTESPTHLPTESPTSLPTAFPTTSPTDFPTISPTRSPLSSAPSWSPSKHPTWSPSMQPTKSPTHYPTRAPTHSPSTSPTHFPTDAPTDSPSKSPSEAPSLQPTKSPTHFPTESPTFFPTHFPTNSPTWSPSKFPTKFPTRQPTVSPSTTPTTIPTFFPTTSPTNFPTISPVTSPTSTPTESPTRLPTESELLTETPTPKPTPQPVYWGRADVAEQFGRTGSTALSRSGIMLARSGVTNRKLAYSEAGDVVFYGVYQTESVAEKELLSAEVQKILDDINNYFQAQNEQVVAVVCDMTIYSFNSTGSPSANTDAATDSGGVAGDFFGLGSSAASIALVAGAGLAVLILTSLVLAALLRRRIPAADARTIGVLSI